MAAQWDLARAWLIQASVVDPALCHCFRGLATQKAAGASLKPKNWRQTNLQGPLTVLDFAIGARRLQRTAAPIISRHAGGKFQTASTGARNKAPIAREERRASRLLRDLML